MATGEHAGASDSSEEFHRTLGEYLARIERDGSAALEQFRSAHPQFASRLGRQLEWLVDHLARRREGLPERIGPYRVVQRLGQGGMGEVFLAEQTTPFRRAVAVKVIRAGGSAVHRASRFAAEIQALASLNHDGIARLFEAGDDAFGPYFTMEYVPGKPITDYCAEERLDLRARLQLFVSVCRAVENAHRHGILHRDLKPSNILVFGPRTEPTAKIIDFGLAKLVENAAERGPRTETGQMVGTPDYMSPEQVDESGERVVDTRSDVYALGVVLYELLTGVLPLSLWQLRGEDVQATLRAIRERQPSSPSVRVEEGTTDPETSPAAGGTVSLRRLSKMLAGDLDAITMKALAKDKDRRYGSAAALADDIVRHLRHEPVSAREPSPWYVASRFVRRHRAAVGFGATLLLGAFASLVLINVVAQANIANLERAELFGLAHYLDALVDRDALPEPARPEHLPTLQAWLADFDRLFEQRARMSAFVDEPVSAGAAGAAAHWSRTEYAGRARRESLRAAVAKLDALASPGHERDRMEQRIAWAKRVVAETVTAHEREWSLARSEVAADPRFAGLVLRPQVGLVPLGRDPRSGLQEFALPLPGCTVPARSERGLAVGPDTCPVFVLVPGGTTLVGSQADDEHGPRYDAGRRTSDPDVTEVTLAPFFVGKYELTNGQWARIDPGDHGRDTDRVFLGPTLPVVSVNRGWLQHVIRAWGMRLPRDHEWEYAARGGADTPFASGREATSLQGHANVHDGSMHEREGVVGEGETAPWNDGFPATSPVGSFAANGFGLHDVHGNANEVAVRTVDGDAEVLEFRGGSWHQGADAARLTRRVLWHGQPLQSVGCRPVISIEN